MGDVGSGGGAMHVPDCIVLHTSVVTDDHCILGQVSVILLIGGAWRRSGPGCRDLLVLGLELGVALEARVRTLAPHIRPKVIYDHNPIICVNGFFLVRGVGRGVRRRFRARDGCRL